MVHYNIFPNLNLSDDNIDKGAQLAFCIAKSMIPEIDSFLDFKEEKKNNIIELQNCISNSEIEIEKLNKEIDATNEEINQLRSLINSQKSEIREEIHRPWKFILIRWIWFLFLGRKWRRNLDYLLENLNKLKQKIISQKNRVEDLKREIEIHNEDIFDKEEEISNIRNELDDLPQIPKIINGISEINIPVFPIEIRKRRIENGNKVISQNIFTFMDVFSKYKEINIPKLESNLDEVISELDFIDSYKTNDVLIQPADDEKEDWGDATKLIGKENELYESIIKVQHILEKAGTVNCSLPIIDKSDPLSTILQEGIDSLEADNNVVDDNKISVELSEKRNAIQNDELILRRFLNEELQDIIKIDNKINQIRKGINEIHTKSTNLRTESSEFLVNYIDKMSYYSNLISNHYYCPKCNVTDTYMKNMWGIVFEDLGDFDKLTTNELKEKSMNFLKMEVFSDKLGTNMNKEEKQDIKMSWFLAFQKLQELEDKVLLLKERAYSAESKVYKLALLREISKKIHYYKKIVKDILKNHRSVWHEDNVDVNPGEDMSLEIFKNTGEMFNENTKLKYSLETETWSCPICESFFDYQEAKMGAVHKIVYDLEIPVLDTLWNDEKVWSKLITLHKDISREHRDRTVQEAESIQSRIDQFLSDSRQIRNTIQQQYAKSAAAMKNVRNMENKFSKFGLIDDDTISELQRIAQQNDSKLKDVEYLMKRMNEDENDLGQVPKEIAFENKISISKHLDNRINKLEEKK